MRKPSALNPLFTEMGLTTRNKFMGRSVIPDQNQHIDDESGFTLLEMLVVVTCIAILAISATVLPNRSPSDWAKLQDLHAKLAENAVLSGRVLGLRVDAQGLHPLMRTTAGWDTYAQPVLWTTTSVQPDALVTFLPSGEHTSLAVTFQTAKQATRCLSDRWGPLTCTQI